MTSYANNPFEILTDKILKDIEREKPLLTTVGAWVKTPGLQPDEPGALNYLTLDQLEKLKQRVETAIARADRAKQKLAVMFAGARVTLTRTSHGIPSGTQGYVASRHMIINQGSQPDDYVPVTFEMHGTFWVPIGYLEAQPLPRRVAVR